MMEGPQFNQIGALSFINALPVDFLFEAPALFEKVFGSPAELNQAMADKRLVLSPVSSAFYLRNQQDLLLLDDLSISSPGPVNSVLLVSPTPPGPEFFQHTSIYVPTHSETSIALLDYLLTDTIGESLLSRFQSYEAPFYEEAMAENAPFLTIGDTALSLFHQGMPPGYIGYDLAQLWQEKTSLPFVFAVWVADKTWARKNPEQLLILRHLLTESRDRFFSDSTALNQAVQIAAGRCTISEEAIRSYFTRDLFYGLTLAHHQALSLFSQILTQPDRPHERFQQSRLRACS